MFEKPQPISPLNLAIKQSVDMQASNEPVTNEQPNQEKAVLVATFYRFVSLERVAELKARVEALGRQYGLLGTILLAEEGVNATVCGAPDALRQWQEAFVALHDGLAGLEFRHTWAETPPFRRWKVKLKKEIVTMGVDGIDPNSITGEHVSPAEWNALIARDDVRVVDTRNHYEYLVGTFERAEDPITDNFREFPGWVDQHLDPKKDEHVAMFCTGGIRCEKATAYLLQQGFKHVYQLDGGILEYLRAHQGQEEQSLWNGECFIFDDRVTLSHGMDATGRQVCCACRKPFAEDQDQAESNVVENEGTMEDEGICADCKANMDEKQLTGVRERMRQVRLAAERGVDHLAPQRLPKAKPLG